MTTARHKYLALALAAGMLAGGGARADLTVVDGGGEIVKTEHDMTSSNFRSETLLYGPSEVGSPVPVTQYEAGGVTVTDFFNAAKGTITVTEYGTVVVELESGFVGAYVSGSGAVLIKRGDQSIATSDGEITATVYDRQFGGSVVQGNALIEAGTESRQVSTGDEPQPLNAAHYVADEEGIVVTPLLGEQEPDAAENGPTEADRARVQRLLNRMKATLENMETATGPAADTPGGFALGVIGQFGTLDAGPVGGTSVIKPDDGPEMATERSPGELDLSGFGLKLAWNTGAAAFWDPSGKSSQTRFYVAWESLSGDGENSSTVPPGQATGAFLFQGLAGHEFTGILLGDSLGLNSASRVEYDEDTFLLGTRWRCELPQLGDWLFEPGIGVKRSFRDWEYESHDSTIRLPDIMARKVINIDEENTYVRAEARLSRRLGPRAFVSFRGGLDFGRVDADLDFVQQATCPSCPMPGLRNVQIEYSDSESDTVVDPFAVLRLNYLLTPNLTLGASWAREERSQATVREALTGDQVLEGRRTTLDIGSESTNLLRLSARWTF